MREQILAHYKQNFNLLVKRYSRAAGTVWDAEEVVHDAYETALYYISRNGSPVSFERWFSVVLRNCLIDKLNSNRGIHFEELNEFDWEGVSYVKKDQLEEFVQSFIDKAPEDHRPVLELHFLQGYSAKEIHIFNSFSYPNARKIIQRFREKIQKELKKE